MNKLLGLFLLAFAFLAPNLAQAANCSWVGGSGTWDNTNTGGGGAGGIKWASATGGGTACAAVSGPAAGVPGPSDTATIDGNVAGLNGGTVTVTGATINVTAITISAANGTVNFGTNNVTTGSLANAGAGTRTINTGSGTWTFNGTGTVLDNSTQTNCTSCIYSNSPLVFTATTTSVRTFNGGGLSYNSFTVNSNTSKSQFLITGANTYASMSIADGTLMLQSQSVTGTITGALTITGTASAPSGFQTLTPQGAITTLSVGSTSTAIWSAFSGITRTGAGTLDATCSFDLGRNTSFTSLTFVGASCGGSGGGRIIGG